MKKKPQSAWSVAIGLLFAAASSYGQEPTLRHTLGGEQAGAIRAIAFKPDGKILASVGGTKAIQFWDVASAKKTAMIETRDKSLLAIAISSDGKTLAESSLSIRLWDLGTEKVTDTLNPREPGIWTLAFSPDAKILASGGADGMVMIWDVKSGNRIDSFLAHGETGVRSVVFSPDGKTLASGGTDKAIKLWDVRSGKNTATWERGHTVAVLCLAFSPDGKTLASAGIDRLGANKKGVANGTIKLWDVATNKNIGDLHGHSSSVFSIAFSPDGKTLVSGSKDTTVRLWDVATAKNTATLREHTGYVYTVAFSPDGKTLASGSNDKTIKLWDVHGK